jgi:hypothetical protein
MKTSKVLLIVAMISLFGLILVSCGKDAGDPPTLPPLESMIIDH